MKKLLTILLFSLVIMLVGCQSPTDYTDDIELLQSQYEDLVVDLELAQDENDLLEQRIVILEGIVLDLSMDYAYLLSDVNTLKEKVNTLEVDFANLSYFEGLNGQREYYVVDTKSNTMQMSNIYLADAIDKTKLPTYLFDVDGNPIDFNYLGEALKLKYFGGEVHIDDQYRVSSRTSLQIRIEDDLPIEEIMVKLYLLLDELSLYDYWLVGSSELLVTLISPTEYLLVSIYMPSFRSEGFNLTLEDYYYETWEIYKTFTFDLELAQGLYEQYVTDETFIGYVLDFK